MCAFQKSRVCTHEIAKKPVGSRKAGLIIVPIITNDSRDDRQRRRPPRERRRRGEDELTFPDEFSLISIIDHIHCWPSGDIIYGFEGMQYFNQRKYERGECRYSHREEFFIAWNLGGSFLYRRPKPVISEVILAQSAPSKLIPPSTLDMKLYGRHTIWRYPHLLVIISGWSHQHQRKQGRPAHRNLFCLVRQTIFCATAEIFDTHSLYDLTELVCRLPAIKRTCCVKTDTHLTGHLVQSKLNGCWTG